MLWIQFLQLHVSAFYLNSYQVLKHFEKESKTCNQGNPDTVHVFGESKSPDSATYFEDLPFESVILHFLANFYYVCLDISVI